MDSPSNGSANYKLQAIKESLKNGSITKEQLFTRLSNAVEQEYQKPVSEQDVAARIFWMRCVQARSM